MRNGLALLAACLALVVASGSAVAQPGPGGKMADPQAQLDMLVERLGLSVDQADAVAPILVEQSDKGRALMEQARGQGRKGFQAMRPKMQALRIETDARLAEHLTSEQMDELSVVREEMRSQMRSQAQSHMRSEQGRQ